MPFEFPDKTEIKSAVESFSQKERRIFWFLLSLTAISGLFFVWSLNVKFTEAVPAPGGSFSEGIIGTPRFVNPLLAISDADRDVTSLVYSGLLRASPDGGFTPDLAEKYEISKDGHTYTFTLRPGLTFHDGTPVTTDDIEFTIARAKDPAIKSPKRPNWEGVSVQKIDDLTISFTLKQPYAPFLEAATLGILPKYLWKDVPVEQFSFTDYNLDGIGSGPYQISSVTKNDTGIPDRYELKRFKNFALGAPYIGVITLHFYGNEDELLKALESKTIDNVSAISPEEADKLSGRQIKKYPLPRVYGVFFNQTSAPVLTELAVRQALNEAVDRERLVEAVLFGYGTPIYGPLPRQSAVSFSDREPGDNSARIDRGRIVLENAGWKLSTTTETYVKKNKKEIIELSFSISTADRPELKTVAELVKEDWGKLGAKVEIKIFESGDLSQNVIRPRKYDALLFGEVVGRDGDLFPFWHSSQRNDPGLNIALYANSTVDKLLEEARAAFDQAERNKKYQEFEKEVTEDVPAIFLYAPDFIYVIGNKISGISVGKLTVPSERFLDVHKWFVEENRVWNIFIEKE